MPTRSLPAVSADQAVSLVQSGMRVFIHGAAATPTPLIEALVARDVRDVTLYHLHTMGPAPFVDPAHRGQHQHAGLAPALEQAQHVVDSDVADGALQGGGCLHPRKG